jgi:hypothetical protein
MADCGKLATPKNYGPKTIRAPTFRQAKQIRGPARASRSSATCRPDFSPHRGGRGRDAAGPGQAAEADERPAAAAPRMDRHAPGKAVDAPPRYTGELGNVPSESRRWTPYPRTSPSAVSGRTGAAPRARPARAAARWRVFSGGPEPEWGADSLRSGPFPHTPPLVGRPATRARLVALGRTFVRRRQGRDACRPPPPARYARGMSAAHRLVRRLALADAFSCGP